MDGYEVKSSVNGWIYVGNDTAIIPGDARSAELDFALVATELTAIDLEIRARRGSTASEYSSSVRFVMPLVPPTSVVAMLTETGMRLAWESLSSLATALAIERAELDAGGAPGAWSPLATVPRAAHEFRGSYLDATVQLGKAYVYRLSTTQGDSRSDGAEVTTLRLAPGLATSTQQLPLATESVSDGQGHVGFAGYPAGIPFPFGALRLIWRKGANWATTDVQAFGLGIQLDAVGLLHAVYTKAPATGSDVVIVHGWSDGAQWLEETIAQRHLAWDTVTAELRFTLDGSNNPVIVWNLGDAFEGASKVSGTWRITRLDNLLPLDGFGYEYEMFSDQSGVGHALFASDGIWHLSVVDGQWTSEQLPVSRQVVMSGGSSPLVAVGHDPDHLAVCTALWSYTAAGLQAGCVRKTPAGWGSVETLGALPEYGFIFHAWAALSADGDRLAVIYRGDATHLFRSDLGGPWTEAIINPRLSVSAVFDRAGKLTVLSGDRTTPQSMTLGDYRVEVEP